MSYPTFRTDYLSEIETRLGALDIPNASDNDLLINGALYKMAAAVAQQDVAKAFPISELVAMDAPAFATWIGSISNLYILAQMLLDPAAFGVLMSDASFPGVLFGNASAMGLIIYDKNLLQAVNANPTAWAAFKAGTGLTSTEVPDMTGNTTPSGTVISSSFSGSDNPYEAFDESYGGWSGGSASNEWIGYTFPSPVFIHTLEFDNTSFGGTTDCANNWTFQVQVNSAWVDLATGSWEPDESGSLDVIYPGKHSSWRLFIADNHGGSTTSINELDFIGFE